MPLKTYTKKRDFRKTQEPRAQKPKAIRPIRGKNLSFVVQEHHASHLHYDFRLEWEGVLKSWAIPKGPSQDPQTKRLAVQVEDHPLAYGEFEGSIPKGQYGAGEVFKWDSGVWIPHGNVDQGFKKGHLEFELKGHKLKGTWDLIRTKSDGKTPLWLLVKRKDDQVVKQDVAKEVGRKKVEKGKISFVQPQLAQLVSEVPHGPSWIHEIKFDGYRLQIHVAGSEVVVFTRSGLDWTLKFPSLVQAFQKLDLPQAIFDGEAVWLDKNGHSNFQELQNALKLKSNRSLYFYAFDLLFYRGRDLRKQPLKNRKKILQGLFSKIETGPLRYSDFLDGQGQAMLSKVCRLGLEGLISKNISSPYTSGRSSNWQKSKCGHRQEFVIGGYTEGQGSRGTIGALLLGQYIQEDLQYVGRVGTGFSASTLKELQVLLPRLETSKSPFQLKSPPVRKNIHWVKPHKIAEVSFSNWTKDEHLRAAVFQGLREDKDPQTVSAEKTSQGKALYLTSPEKMIYQKEQITKLEVAEYYIQAASWMVPLIQGRPLSLFRSPKGTKKAGFFQKHRSTGEMPPGVNEIWQEEKGKKNSGLVLDSAEGLLSLVQMGAFEIHCSNARYTNLEHPDQIVMDFDPDSELPWKRTVQAALTLKKILEQLKLRSFVKVSGGKGLHVHIPLRPNKGWTQVKAFSKALASLMVEQQPDLYTTQISKAKRHRMIFIDFLRNGKSATAVAPYSLRARSISAVAMPVSWSELLKLKGSDQFDLRTARQYLRKRKMDPWKDISQTQQSLPALS